MARSDSIDGELLDRFSLTIDQIYAAALNPTLWTAAVQSIANLHDCPTALLLTPDTSPADGGFIFTHGISEQALELWGQKYVEHDPWVKAADEKDLYREGLVLFSEDLLPREEMVNSLFFREFAQSLDLWNFCTGIVFDGGSPKSPRVNSSFFSGRAARPFDDLDRNLHLHTIRHLSRALGTMFRLRNAELHLASSVAALNRLDAGVLLFGRAGNVVFTNEAATNMVCMEDGLKLRPGDPQKDALGWLIAAQPTDDQKLKRELTEAVTMQLYADRHFSTGIPIQRPSGKRPYLIQISPLTPNNEFSRWEREVFAIGFLTELGASKKLDPGLLTRTFNLTKAETALAQEILTGDSLSRIAERLFISENTVKTQLASIFEKTATHRQAQLVKLLVGLTSPDYSSKQ